MATGAVHQFHSGTATGDAITNQMLDLQRRLRAAGYYSEIYSEHIAGELVEQIRPLSDFRDLPSTLLIVHHSMGHTAFGELMQLTVPMVTVFHSITPASFFDDAVLRQYIRLGFAQLRTLAGRSLFGVADSNHNRHQMYDAGFASVEVMPVRTDFHEQRALRERRQAPSGDWLFVGRVVPNKRQLELVRAFGLYVRTYGAGHLHLVGDLSMQGYVEQIRHEVALLGLTGHVTIHGKISHQQLLERYRQAGLFVCLSEHEGFGVPLLEAMAAGVPVIARAEAAVAETMGGAGALVSDGDPATIASLAHVLASDESLRARLVAHQDRRLTRIEAFDVGEFLERLIARAAQPTDVTSVQIQGPFETSYSLAILNRELALALSAHDEFDVTIHATEGPGDYTPRAEDLDEHPVATEMFIRSATVPYPEIAIRQMYPPRVDDSPAGMTFQYFGWEESRLPADVVADFNRHLDGIGTMSSYVRDLLTESGVVVPMAVVGVGVHAPDHSALVDLDELTGIRTTRFLHISSAFPRKAVDVLLRAYFTAFSGSDDVSLVLKTFPNPHNEVGQLLTTLHGSHPNPPHVCWIDRDLDRAQLDGLYGLADCYVHVARGEGFGLPVAEAMLADVPVIAVAATGLADFVSPETAAVVGHRLEPARTHLSVPGSKWAEPNIDDLVREMLAVVAKDEQPARERRTRAAHSLIETEYTWARVAQRWHDFLLERRAARVGRSVAAVTTFNSRCGIAEYSAHLYEPMEEWAHIEIHADRNVVVHDPGIEDSIQRSWSNHRAEPLDSLIDSLAVSTADVLHIQYNFGFYTLPELGRLLRDQVARRAVVLTLHRTMPLELDGRIESLGDITSDLLSADAIIVHQESDRLRLAQLGIVHNVHLVPIGTEPVVDLDRRAARRRHGVPVNAFVLGTYGFLLPHKGLTRLLRAMAALRSRGVNAFLVATCALHPDPSSAMHLDEVLAEIRRLELDDSVRLITDFLSPELSRDLLACSDVVVLPYEHTNESSSAALRSVLKVGRAIVTSELPIFADAAAAVRSLPAPIDPDALADLLEELWLDPDECERIATAVRQFAVTTSWTNVARRTRQLYADVVSARAGDEPHATDGSLAMTALPA